MILYVEKIHVYMLVALVIYIYIIFLLAIPKLISLLYFFIGFFFIIFQLLISNYLTGYWL